MSWFEDMTVLGMVAGLLIFVALYFLSSLDVLVSGGFSLLSLFAFMFIGFIGNNFIIESIKDIVVYNKQKYKVLGQSESEKHE